MSDIIPIPKQSLERILKPINRLTESCVLKTSDSGLYSVCSSMDNTVILYAEVKVPLELKTHLRFNLINIKKFLCGLECLGNDGNFSIKYNNNSLKCCNTSTDEEKTHFKYHLVDDSVIKECPFNLKKMSELIFDTEFDIESSKIKQIMAGYAFASDVSKIYFSTKDGGVYAEINDKTLQNIDNITIKVADKFSGQPIDTATPINTEIFKNLASCRNDIKVRINNEYKVFIFQNKDDNDVELKYIVSALVK